MMRRLLRTCSSKRFQSFAQAPIGLSVHPLRSVRYRRGERGNAVKPQPELECLEIAPAFSASALGCVPQVEASPARQARSGIVQHSDTPAAPDTNEPGAPAAKMTPRPNHGNALRCAAAEFDICAPSVTRNPNNSWPLKRGQGERHKLLPESTAAVEMAHREGPELFNSAVLCLARCATVSRHVIAPNVPSRYAYRASRTACGSLRVSDFSNPLRMSVSISVSRNWTVRQRSPSRRR